MHQVNLFKRVTHRFHGGWAGQDGTEFVGSIKMTPPIKVAEGDSWDEGGTYLRYARLPARGTDMQMFSKAVRDTMGGTACRHQHDCCGCASYNISVKRINSRTVQIKTRVLFNY